MADAQAGESHLVSLQQSAILYPPVLCLCHYVNPAHVLVVLSDRCSPVTSSQAPHHSVIFMICFFWTKPLKRSWCVRLLSWVLYTIPYNFIPSLDPTYVFHTWTNITENIMTLPSPRVVCSSLRIDIHVLSPPCWRNCSSNKANCPHLIYDCWNCFGTKKFFPTSSHLLMCESTLFCIWPLILLTDSDLTLKQTSWEEANGWKTVACLSNGQPWALKEKGRTRREI